MMSAILSNVTIPLLQSPFAFFCLYVLGIFGKFKCPFLCFDQGLSKVHRRLQHCKLCEDVVYKFLFWKWRNSSTSFHKISLFPSLLFPQKCKSNTLNYSRCTCRIWTEATAALYPWTPLPMRPTYYTLVWLYNNASKTKRELFQWHPGVS